MFHLGRALDFLWKCFSLFVIIFAMKKLVLAEKPSVARELSKALNCFERGSGYIEGSDYVVTWALGHLIELCEPSHYSDAWKRWTLASLPMIPAELDERVIEQTHEQYDNIVALLKRGDITSVIIATDAGREGELVARWILKAAGYKGKMERLWISSQTEKAIKEGFASLKSSDVYDNLYKAAEARSAADWYVGMNVTRALTCFYDAKMSAGRVQTPTLALMTKREDEIDAFLGNFYYSARADFGLFAASFYPEENSIRFTDKELKEDFETNWAGKEGTVIKVESEEKEEKAPLAYDLTELQRDANIQLGFSAKDTLDILQRLYEVHKIVTYPRTDSRYITSDIVPTLPERLKALEATEFSLVAREYRLNGFSFEEDRLVQEALVTDHHAIIPTEETVRTEKLSSEELKLWRLIAMRFLEVLSPSYKYRTTSVVIEVEGKQFKTRVSESLRSGWKSVSIALNLRSAAVSDEPSEGGSPAILRCKEGDKVTINKIKVRENTTTPPSRYTDATLLSAMEHAGRFVDDMKVKGNLSGGLGTPATRADIIEKLIQNHYVEREGKYLVPTAKGREVVRLSPAVLQSPELTGVWEGRLDEIAKGKAESDEFIKDIKKMTKTLVDEVKTSTDKFRPNFKDAKKCPYCGSDMMRALDNLNQVHYICQRLSCSYEEKEVKVKIETGVNREKKAPLYTDSGKVKVVIKKNAVKAPSAVYETRIEVVNPSKLKGERGDARGERREYRKSAYASAYGAPDSSGGTFADFFKQSQERQEKKNKKRK